ncbi:hypothetical protein ACC745_39470, partial [Rhizobium ruizarguesonis]
VPMAAGIALCAFSAFALTQATIGRRTRALEKTGGQAPEHRLGGEDPGRGEGLARTQARL